MGIGLKQTAGIEWNHYDKDDYIVVKVERKVSNSSNKTKKKKKRKKRK